MDKNALVDVLAVLEKLKEFHPEVLEDILVRLDLSDEAYDESFAILSKVTL